MSRRRGSIRKSGGSWEVSLYIGTDVQGRRQYRYATVRGSKREAERKLTEMLFSKDNETERIRTSRVNATEEVRNSKDDAPSSRPTREAEGDLLGVGEVARLLNISSYMVKRLAKRGYFYGVTCFGPPIRFYKPSLESWIMDKAQEGLLQKDLAGRRHREETAPLIRVARRLKDGVSGIYMIRCDETNLYKIGKTRDLASRLKTHAGPNGALNRALGGKCRLVRFISVPEHLLGYFEPLIHWTFQESRQGKAEVFWMEPHTPERITTAEELLKLASRRAQYLLGEEGG